MSRDLNELSKEIYEANKAKGFHEEKHSFNSFVEVFLNDKLSIEII